jgi:hypothetical protein
MHAVHSAVVTVNPDVDCAGHVLSLLELSARTIVVAAFAKLASPKTPREEAIVGRSD